MVEITKEIFKLETEFNIYFFSAHTGVTLTSLTNPGGKRYRVVGKKDVFLQNT